MESENAKVIGSIAPNMELSGSAPQIPAEEFTADELRLLQNVLHTDRKTLDYIEGVVAGTDVTDRRAQAGVLLLKVRRMLDRAIMIELQEQTKKKAEEERAIALAEEGRKRLMEEQEKAAAELVKMAVQAEPEPEKAPKPALAEPPTPQTDPPGTLLPGVEG